MFAAQEHMVCMVACPRNCFRASTTRPTVKSLSPGQSMRRMVGSTAESSFSMLLSTRLRASATAGLKMRVELDSTDTLARGNGGRAERDHRVYYLREPRMDCRTSVAGERYHVERLPFRLRVGEPGLEVGLHLFGRGESGLARPWAL